MSAYNPMSLWWLTSGFHGKIAFKNFSFCTSVCSKITINRGNHEANAIPMDIHTFDLYRTECKGKYTRTSLRCQCKMQMLSTDTPQIANIGSNIPYTQCARRFFSRRYLHNNISMIWLFGLAILAATFQKASLSIFILHQPRFGWQWHIFRCAAIHSAG